jgi:AcrR family transcriptional regulator
MGIAERKLIEKSAREKLILDSALAVFHKKGFADATIGDIAEQAQIAKGTIYLYFKSKADLFFSLTKPALENLANRLKRIANHKSDEPDVKLRKLMYAVYDFYVQDADAYNLITRYKAAEYQDLFPEDRLRIIRRLMRSNLKFAEIVIEEAIREGLIKRIDPYSGAVFFWSSFIGIIQFQENRMMPGKKDYRKETLDQLIEMLMEYFSISKKQVVAGENGSQKVNEGKKKIN